MSRWSATMRAHLGPFTLDVELGGDDGVLALIGPNGSGKTTALRVLAGALAAERAVIEVDGRSLDGPDGHVPLEHRRVGYLPQGHGLFPHLSAEDNVAFGLSMGPRRRPKAERRAAARALLGELGCAELASRSVAGLSGGERQRVALARALIVEPALLLLDEPLAALDAISRRAVRRFLAERLPAYGRPAVLVTHDVRDVEALDATVCALEGGKVIQRGTLAELRAAPATPFVEAFITV